MRKLIFILFMLPAFCFAQAGGVTNWVITPGLSGTGYNFPVKTYITHADGTRHTVITKDSANLSYTPLVVATPVNPTDATPKSYADAINASLTGYIDAVNAAIPIIYSGSYSTTGTSTTTFTVTIGATQANTAYKVNATPTSSVAAASFYVTNKTTTTFDVVYLTGLTGAVSFDWSLFK